MSFFCNSQQCPPPRPHASKMKIPFPLYFPDITYSTASGPFGRHATVAFLSFEHILYLDIATPALRLTEVAGHTFSLHTNCALSSDHPIRARGCLFLFERRAPFPFRQVALFLRFSDFSSSEPRRGVTINQVSIFFSSNQRSPFFPRARGLFFPISLPCLKNNRSDSCGWNFFLFFVICDSLLRRIFFLSVSVPMQTEQWY